MPLYNRAVILASGGVKEFWKARRNAWEGGAMHRLMVVRRILREIETISILGMTFAKRRIDLSTIKAVEQKLRILEDKGFIRCCDGKIHFLRKNEKEIDIVKTTANIIQEDAGIDGYAKIKKAYGNLFKKINSFDEVPDRQARVLRRRYYALRHPFLLSEAYDIAAAEILGNRYRAFARYTNVANISRRPECVPRYEFIRSAITEAKRLPPSRITSDLQSSRGPSYDKDVDVLDICPSNALEHKFAVVFGDTHVMPMKHTETSELMRFFWMVNTRLQATKIGNGDILDIWAYGGKLEEILEANPMFIRGLVGNQKFIYIPGNHDAFMTRLFKKFDWILRPQIIGVQQGELYDANLRLFIKHGHQMDVFNKPDAESGRIATRVAYSVSRFLGNRYGPRFLRWAELSTLLFIPKEIWQEERVRKTVQMVRDDFIRLSDERAKRGEEPFSPDKPLTYIVGHQHSMGLTYTFEQIRREIELDGTLSRLVRDGSGNVIGGRSKVDFFFSGTWYDKKLYAGDFIVLDVTDPEKLCVFPFCWNYTLPEWFIAYYKKEAASIPEKRRVLSDFVSLLQAKIRKGNQ